MSGRYDDARRGLESASLALAALRRETGSAEEAPAGDAAAAAGLRAALEAARRLLEDKARELEAAKARVRELESGREDLLARVAVRPDPALAERAQRAEAEAAKVKLAAAAEAASMNGRLSLQQAEFVRLNALRRKAEEAVEQSELTRRDVEDALRRDLRSVNGALDRAASEAGTREARAQSDIQGLTRRLEAALTRTEQLSREQQAERERWRVERQRLAATLQRSSAVHASLRRDLEEAIGGRAPDTDALPRRLASAELDPMQARAGQDPRVEELTRQLSARAANEPRILAAARSEHERALADAEARAAELARRLEASTAAQERLAGTLEAGDRVNRAAAAEGELEKLRSRLSSAAPELASLRSGAAEAYERLRELSALVPLSDAERVSLKRAAAALGEVNEAVARLERSLGNER